MFCSILPDMIRHSKRVILDCHPRLVDTMERSGLVMRRRCDSDRRVIYVELTDKGRKVFAKLWPGHVERVAEAVSILSPEEQKALAELCKKLGTE